MQALYPLLATLAGYLVGSLSFAVIVSRVMGLKDPAHLRLEQSGRHQRPAFGQQGRGDHHAGARRPEGLRPGGPRRRVRLALGAGRGHRGAGRPGSLPRPRLAGVLPLPRRQGRGHRGRRAARHQSPARPGDAPDLGDRRRLLPLLVAGLHRRRGLRAVLPAADLGRRPGGGRDHRDGAVADLAPRRQHQEAPQGNREPDRAKSAATLAPSHPASHIKATGIRTRGVTNTAVDTATEPNHEPGTASIPCRRSTFRDDRSSTARSISPARSPTMPARTSAARRARCWRRSTGCSPRPAPTTPTS